MTTLDISLSKIQILMESKDLPQFENFRTDFDDAKNSLDAESTEIKILLKIKFCILFYILFEFIFKRTYLFSLII